MCLTIFTSAAVWVADTTNTIKNRALIVATDPSCFLAGSIAGAAGRAAVIPYDKGHRGPVTAVYRRAPQWGIVFWTFVPLKNHLVHDQEEPYQKFQTTLFCGFAAGVLMRVLTNPFTAIREAVHAGEASDFMSAATKIAKDKGLTGFYARQHPIIANGCLYAFTFAFFEAFRTFASNHGAPAAGVAGSAIIGTGAGLLGSTCACLVSYPLSRLRYDGSVAHDTAVSRGIVRAVLKEAPQAAVAFGVFSAIAPLIAPHHGETAGFGF